MVTKTRATPSMIAPSRSMLPAMTGAALSIRCRFDRRRQGTEREQDGAVSRAARARRSKRHDSRPVGRRVRPAKPFAELSQRQADLAARTAGRSLLRQARRRLAERTSEHDLRERFNAPLGVELDDGLHPAAAGRGSK